MLISQQFQPSSSLQNVLLTLDQRSYLEYRQLQQTFHLKGTKLQLHKYCQLFSSS